MLRVEGLTVHYGKIRALERVTIEVGRGEVVAVIGRNGAGKTTLLKAVMGLVRPTTGKIMFMGRDITGLPPWVRAEMGIGYVPEGRRLFPYLTVMENLLMGAYVVRSREDVERGLQTVFQLFPILRERRNQLARTLSGGEGEMLAIARGLMSNAKLLLMDEPSLGLAPIVVKEVFKVIKRLKERGVTILLVEQNARKALEVADRCYVLETGRVVFHSDAKSAMEHPMVKKAYLGIE